MNACNSKTFCILPWIHLNIMPDSTVLPCCVSPYDDVYGKGSDQSLQEIINSDKFKKLRKNMLSSVASDGCNHCYQLESNGFRSMRMEMNNSFQKYISLCDKTAPDGSITNFELKYIDIRFSNLCNFKCRGCGPTLSHSWYEDHQAVYNYKSTQNKITSIAKSAPVFWEELRSLIPHADIIYFGGGEPLISNEHYEILSHLISINQCDKELRYTTNLSKLNFGAYDLAELWSKFRRIQVGISIDDFGKRAEYFRHGTKWEIIEANLKLLITQHPNVERIINCTVNIMNIYYLPDIWQYIFNNKIVLPANFHINLLLDPAEYRVDILTDSMKIKVKNKLKKYKYYLTGMEGDYLCTIRDIDNILKFMSKKDLSDQLTLFKNTTSKLDSLRSERFEQTFPELAKIIN